MSTITVLGQPAVSTRKITGFIQACRNALQERRKRQKVRAALYRLNDRDLHDIGISHEDIEYVAAHREIEPRSI